MKMTTAAPEDAITEAAPSIGDTNTRPTATEIAQEVRRLEKLERIQKAGGHVGPTAYFVRFHESPEDSARRLNSQLTEESVGDRTLRLQKFILPDDVLEVAEGDREPPEKTYRLLGVEEVIETLADARSLQTGARIRKLQAPKAKAEGDLRRVIGEIANSKEVVKSMNERIESLEAERLEKEAAVKRASAPLEEFFSGKPEAWKEKALVEAGRTDRDALPPAPPPERPRAHFAQRADGEGKDFAWNAATGQHERIR